MRKFAPGFFIGLIAFGHGLLAQQPEKAEKEDASAEIAALQTPFRTETEMVAAELEKWKATLETWYAEGLAKLMAERTQAGDLDGSLAVKAEQERLAGHQPVTEAQVRAMAEPLLNLRMTYEATLKKLTDEADRRRGPLRQKLLDDLEALQRRITMSGDIAQAILVKAERDRRKAEFAATSAAPGTAPQPPAPKPPEPAPASLTPPPPPTGKLAYGKPVPDKPGFVQSPYAPESGYVDVRGYAAGAEVKDPYSGKPFLVPGSSEPWSSTPWEKLPKGDTPAVLVGTWKVEEVGIRDKKARYLLPKGMLLAQGISGTGDWRVIEGKLILTFPSGATEEMPGPIDPKGTKGAGDKGRVLQAIKEKSEVPWPATRPAIPAGAEASTLAGEAALKALLGGTRWAWSDIEKPIEQTRYWHDFYADGSAANSWGRQPIWETLPPNLLHIYDASDNRHWYLDVDLEKREAISNPKLDRNKIRMRFQQPATGMAVPAGR